MQHFKLSLFHPGSFFHTLFRIPSRLQKKTSIALNIGLKSCIQKAHKLVYIQKPSRKAGLEILTQRMMLYSI